MRDYVLTLLISAVVAYLLTPGVRGVAIKVRALHEARDRDVHVVPIPLLGGLAMYAGLAAGLAAATQLPPLRSAFTGSHTEAGLLAAGGVLVVVGFIDDLRGMSPLAKLAGQVAAGALVVYSGAQIAWLPLPDGSTLWLSPDQSVALTILVVVATINAVNFIDGLDGLAAGIVAIAAGAFFVYYYTLTDRLHLSVSAGPALVSALLAGICIGFLPHNFYPARIFMGDAGAALLGLLLAYAVTSSSASLDPSVLSGPRAYSLGTLNRFPEVLPLLLPAAFLVIPYADMLLAVIRRTRAGRSPFAPDRKHLHHRMLDIGHSHRSSVLIMYLWATLFSGSVVVLSIVRTKLYVLALLTAAAIIVLLLMSMPRLRWWRRDRGARPTAGPAPAPGPGPAARPEPVTPGTRPEAAAAPAAALPGPAAAPPGPAAPPTGAAAAARGRRSRSYQRG